MKNDTKYPGEIVGYIYRTPDYDVFRKMEGNRDVADVRKKVIKESIQAVGWVTNPIVVNEKMEIADGQGRFEALKELGLPIEYAVAEGATIDHCIALNLKQRNWTLVDYIKSYAEQGDEDAAHLLRMILKYGNISVTTIIELMTPSGKFRNFDLKNNIDRWLPNLIDEFSADEILEFFGRAFSQIGKEKGRSETWAKALKTVFYADEIDNDTFLHNLERRAGTIQGIATSDQALQQLETIVNYYSRDKVILKAIEARLKREAK